MGKNIHYGKSIPWTTTQQEKETKDWCVKRLGWIPKELCSVKKKRYKYIGFLKRQNYRIGELVSGGQGLGKVGGRELAEAIEGKIRNSGQGVVPYLDLIIT